MRFFDEETGDSVNKNKETLVMMTKDEARLIMETPHTNSFLFFYGDGYIGFHIKTHYMETVGIILGLLALGIIIMSGIIFHGAHHSKEENDKIYRSHCQEDEEISSYRGNYFEDSAFHDDCGDR